LIDFHCHLDLYSDPIAVARRAQAEGIGVLSVTNTPSAWRGTSQLADGHSVIRTALGLHPQLAKERKFELELFDELLPQTGYVGEIGLDGSTAFRSGWQDQLDVLDHILSACQAAGGKHLSLHSRNAVPAVLELLSAFPRAGLPVLHWFSGSQKQLTDAQKLDCWFSIGPAMLTGAKGFGLVASMPRDRVLLETDGPFTNLRGLPLVPRDIASTLVKLGEAWGISPSDARAQVRLNEEFAMTWKGTF
jgi:TatD DNase family protein